MTTIMARELLAGLKACLPALTKDSPWPFFALRCGPDKSSIAAVNQAECRHYSLNIQTEVEWFIAVVGWRRYKEPSWVLRHHTIWHRPMLDWLHVLLDEDDKQDYRLRLYSEDHGRFVIEVENPKTGEPFSRASFWYQGDGPFPFTGEDFPELGEALPLPKKKNRGGKNV